jgi:iron complex outermembrane recepter protein
MPKSGLVKRANVDNKIRRSGAVARANWLIPAAVAAAIAGGSAAVRAQDQQPAQDSQVPIAEVTVTGSRIIRQGFASPTPVTALSADELLASRPESLVEGLATLPSLSGGSTTNQDITGSTKRGPGNFLNLRNLGGIGDNLVPRTLVLLDGRRVAPSNDTGNIDINMLPQALISSVNIVTGGASAAYGSDAVAGVVDFRLDTHFTGLKAEVDGGVADAGDGEYHKFSLAGGTNFFDNRLHIIASFDFLRSAEAFANNRPWASGHCLPIPVPGVTTATQSATNPRQVMACNVQTPYASYGGAIYSGPLTTPTQGIAFGPGGVPGPFNYGALKSANYMAGGNGSYYADNVNFDPPARRKVAFTHISYDVSDNIQAFAQVTVASSWSDYEQNSPFFYPPRPFTIFSGNPFIPASVQSQMTQLGVSNFPLGIVAKPDGIITVNSEYTNYDAVAGLQGKFGDGWSWDASFERGKTEFRSQMYNYNVANIYRAADAVVDPSTGQTVCYATLHNAPNSAGCVPIDLFGPGAASAAALNYVRGNLIYNNDNTQTDVAATLHGEPFTLWAGPVSVATGVEYRDNTAVATTDAISAQSPPINTTGIRGFPASLVNQPGGWLTFNPKPEGGSANVKELFGEVVVPLAKDLPFARSIDFNAAVRGIDYSTSGKVATWKYGGTWQPVSDLLIRATESRDIRAPSMTELYASPSSGPTTVFDPFMGNASVNIKTFTQGNPNLQAEKAQTFTGGFTYTPSWIRGLGLSIDYYDIKIKQALGTLAVQDEINECFAGATSLCSLLQRDSTGVLQYVTLPTLNLSQLRSRGVDLEFSYRMGLSTIVSSWSGSASLRMIGTRLLEQSTTVPTSTGVSYVDRVGDIGQGNPKWRVNAIASLEQGPIGLDITGRFIGSGLYNSTYVVGDISNNHVPSNFTMDVDMRYTLTSLPGNPQLSFNVVNVFNRDPPLVPGTALFSPETNAALYNTIGRFYSAGIKVRF